MSDDSDFYIRSAIAMLEASNEIGRLEAENRTLRKAIAAWPVVPHWYDCGMFEKRGGFYLETECTCGVGAANAARAAARKAAGLED